MTGGHSIIESWNGNSWSLVTSPNYGYLQDVTCASSDNCWSVGYGPNGTLTVQWDGSAWSVVSSANAAADLNELFAIACPSAAQCWAVGEFNVSTDPYVFPATPAQTLVEVYSVTTPPLINVGSRMTHGFAGTFDLNLPLTGTPAIECRRGGANGNYSVVFNFANDVTNCGTPTNAGGSAVAGPNTNQCTVNLTGVPNGQTINVELDNVTDSFNNTGNVSVPMGVLVGDTTGNGIVNSSDIAQTQSQSGQPVTQSNFREDVTANGIINSSDIGLVQSLSGTALPAAPASTLSSVSKSKPRKPARNQ